MAFESIKFQSLVVKYPSMNIVSYRSIKYVNNYRDESANVAIIREVYDTENAHETFEYELERALEAECTLIVIEPSKLGDETSRWIAVGNCLHKTAALSGLAAIATGTPFSFI